MSNTYSVVITGEILDGFELESVQQAFAKLFKLSHEKVQKYFVGKPKILKKQIDFETANKYKARIEQVGALVELRAAAKLESAKAELAELASIKPASAEKAPISVSKYAKVSQVTEPSASQLTQLDPSINIIEAARLEQARRLQAIEFAEEKSNSTLVVIGSVALIYAVAEIGLDFMNVVSITGTIWVPMVIALVGIVSIISSRAS